MDSNSFSGTKPSAVSLIPAFRVQPAWFARRNARSICSIASSTDRRVPSGHLESILDRTRDSADFNSPSCSEAVIPERSAPSRSWYDASSLKSRACRASLCASLYTSSLDCSGANRLPSRTHGSGIWKEFIRTSFGFVTTSTAPPGFLASAGAVRVTNGVPFLSVPSITKSGSEKLATP